MVIDFHAHAFPDALAECAVPRLAREANVAARADGKVATLLRSMDAAGIERAVICSIATRPAQFDKILEWSRAVASDRLIPLPSVHPAAPDVTAQVRRIADAGFRGLKLHPYYQEFALDEPRLDPLYETAAARGLLLVAHTGFDIAYPRVRCADPARIARVVARHPALKLITTHLGGWEDWDEVERHLLGRPVYMETSFSTAYLGAEKTAALLRRHPADYLLFGTDTPWADQAEELERVRGLALPPDRMAQLLGGNAARLLGL